MTTITCGANRVEVTVIGEIGADVLYRDKYGRYYVQNAEPNPLTKQAKWSLREWLEYHAPKRARVRPMSPRAAMLWYVDRFVTDPLLANLFRAAIVAGGGTAQIIPFPKPAVLRRARA